jgi:hypothetical protein
VPRQFLTPTAGSQNVKRTQATQDLLQTDHRCFNGGEKGHCANRCPNPCTHANQPATATAAPAHTSRANSVPIAAKQNYARERVYHVTMVEAQEAPDVVIGMFSINDASVVVLFDSAASHSFISTTYVGKHNLPLVLLKCQMIVSSLGGDMPARQLCSKVNLKIRG